MRMEGGINQGRLTVRKEPLFLPLKIFPIIMFCLWLSLSVASSSLSLLLLLHFFPLQSFLSNFAILCFSTLSYTHDKRQGDWNRESQKKFIWESHSQLLYRSSISLFLIKILPCGWWVVDNKFLTKTQGKTQTPILVVDVFCLVGIKFFSQFLNQFNENHGFITKIYNYN